MARQAIEKKQPLPQKQSARDNLARAKDLQKQIKTIAVILSVAKYPKNLRCALKVQTRTLNLWILRFRSV